MKYILFFTTILLFASCASIRVNYDYDKAVDFTKYKTYKYFADIETGLSALDQKRFLDALDTKMAEKGFTIAKNPDFLIDIKSKQREVPQQQTVGFGIGGGGGNIGGGISIGVPVGQPKLSRQIIVEFVDNKGVGLFWQADSESGFKPNQDPLKRESRLQAIAHKILNAYPPKVK